MNLTYLTYIESKLKVTIIHMLKITKGEKRKKICCFPIGDSNPGLLGESELS